MSSALEGLIDRYATGGVVLVYAVSGLTRDQELAHPGDGAGKWTIAQLVAHLVDSDLVGADRIKRVIAEPEPTLLAYDENAWVERLRSGEMSVEEGVYLFAANRRWIATVLKGCPEADFSRAGNHTERGRQTLAELISGYANHLDHHLRFLYAKRANLGAAVQPRYSYATS
jgi:hypothetical protein